MQQLFAFLAALPELSETVGRCGPVIDNGRCNRNKAYWAVYCNIETGWCGDTSDFRDAQDEDIYDFQPSSMPGILGKREYWNNCLDKTKYSIIKFTICNTSTSLSFLVLCEDKQKSCTGWVNHYGDRFCGQSWFTSDTGNYGCKKSCGLC